MPDRKKTPVLSIVVPAYNEEEVLAEAARQLEGQLLRMIDMGIVAKDSHIIFVDDGSRDRTWKIVEDLHEISSLRMRGLKLSRNAGHQHAVLAGLLSASGDLVISIDADLQDDIHAMERMVESYADGADIVLGVRRERSTDSPFKRITAQLYYKLLLCMNVNVVPDHADYRLLSRRAIEALRGYEETNLFLRGIVMQLGFRVATVSYSRTSRIAGSSKYTLRRMIGLALDGVTSFSVMPLRYITTLGFVISAISFLLASWAVILKVVFRNTVPGWASIVIPIYLICGVQMICLGIMGEYIGKIYMETKRRSRYIVEATLPKNKPADNGAISGTLWQAGVPRTE
jgi:glycosyltransferase involved in cell wall biosynthesis